jgi:hypothetical protein
MGEVMMPESVCDRYRREAHLFFSRLESHLNQNLPPPAKIRASLRRARASKGKREPWNKTHELAFLNKYIFPLLHDFLAGWPGMNKQKACEALLVEGYKHNPGIASGTPARFVEHPFAKSPESASEIMKRWKKSRRGSLSGGRFADMALRKPYKTVFECKYFAEDDIGEAESALVEGVYEAFYYLGLPRFPEGRRGKAWDYDFACFLAGDASDQGALCKAWGSVSAPVKRGIWDGGNIYVMIVRGGS